MENNTTEFLLEIGTEEIPAGYIPPALDFLKNALHERLDSKLLFHGEIKNAGTPRRLAVHVQDLALKQPDREIKIMGPPARIAFNPDGTPAEAALGFAKRNNVAVDQLKVEETKKGAYLCIKKTELGKPAIEILAVLLPRLLADIPFPKAMRWGTGKFRFARPIRWIVSLLGNEVVPFEAAGLFSDRITYGHRFMSKGPIILESASFEEYKGLLKEAFCICDVITRKETLVEGAQEAVRAYSGYLLEDNELLELNTFLTEFPSAVCGSFDEKFLRLPDPVLITCMKEHQKYFAVTDRDGKLMANFVAINNTLSSKPDLVKNGHQRVLTARLSDAEFFFKEDTRRNLEDFVPELAGMIFHQGLGTLLDKTQRVQKISEFLASELSPRDLQTVRRAAWLCKADLCTEMVGEFPTLQGIMGREYAMLSGEDPTVASAIKEHYLPIRSGGELPRTMPGVLLSIADKIDTIVSTFAIGLKPTGTQDPYALRRQALGIIHILLARKLDLSLKALINESINTLGGVLSEIPASLHDDITGFFKKRYTIDLISRGLDYDVVEAAVRADFDSLFDCYQRALAINAARNLPEFEPISIAFKRVMNILKGFPGGEVDNNLFEEPQEKVLHGAFIQVKEQIYPLLRPETGQTCPDAEQYKEALLLLLSLKPHIDDFFDNVMVMVEDEKLRENRLALLWMIAKLFLKIGDLSTIVVTENQD